MERKVLGAENDTGKMLYMKRALRDATRPACDNKHKV